MSTVADVVAALEAWAPLTLAAEWDNVGLLLGDPQTPAEKVMTCLTVTPDSAREAIETGARLIVTHHPILFRSTKKLTAATSEGRMLLGLAQAGIAVYSAHTAYDNATGGINDLLAQKFGLTDVVPLRIRADPPQYKIAVFVPEKDLAKVSDAMFSAGAGQIGQYRECSFRVAGTGTFFGSEATNPVIGERGRREEVQEWRLEVLCPEAKVNGVLAAMRAAHSYEEPAFDVYALRMGRAKGGEGRLGRLPTPMLLQDFARAVKHSLKATSVQMVGWPGQSVQRVAIACGAAGEFLSDAATRQADVFVTGEARFHDALASQSHRIGLVLPGHYATERFAMEALAARLHEEFPAIKVWASERESDPLTNV